MPFRIAKNAPLGTLIFLVVDAITDEGICGALILVGHGLWRLRPSLIRKVCWRVKEKPEHMLLTGVRLISKPMAEFQAQRKTELAEPPVVLETVASPNRAGVLGIPDRKVAMAFGPRNRCRSSFQVRLHSSRLCEHPVRRIEKLGRL